MHCHGQQVVEAKIGQGVRATVLGGLTGRGCDYSAFDSAVGESGRKAVPELLLKVVRRGL